MRQSYMSAHAFFVMFTAMLCLSNVYHMKCNVALKPVMKSNHAVPLAPSQTSYTPSKDQTSNTAQVCPSPAGRDTLAG